MADSREQIHAMIRDAPAELRQVVAEVLRLERDKLHLKLPRGIVEDITDLVRKIVT
jgi:hypothetical protein